MAVNTGPYIISVKKTRDGVKEYLQNDSTSSLELSTNSTQSVTYEDYTTAINKINELVELGLYSDLTIEVVERKVASTITRTFESDNFNAGIVRLKCLINQYCPCEATPPKDIVIMLNGITMESVPNGIRDNFSWVPGEMGIYLKEVYEYASQYLFIRGEPICENVLMTAFGDITDPQILANKWIAKKSVFQPKDVELLRRSEYESKSSLDPDLSVLPRWRCDIAEEKNDDGNDILMPTQKSSSPTYGKGVHWKVQKAHPLFAGQDFWVILKRGAYATDISTSPDTKNKLFVDESYRFLDANRDSNDSGSFEYAAAAAQAAGAAGFDAVAAAIRGNSNSDSGSIIQKPYNEGVTGYTYDVKSKSFNKDKESAELMNFNTQAYYIIEMDSSDFGGIASYYIIITQKAKPRFVKVVGGNSYALSEYQASSGGALIAQDSLRITIRNHLGKIVIVFEGLEDKPWVIEDLPLKAELRRGDIFRVPRCHLSLWGGNISAAFLHNSLHYRDHAILNLPIPNKEVLDNPESTQQIQDERTGALDAMDSQLAGIQTKIDAAETEDAPGSVTQPLLDQQSELEVQKTELSDSPLRNPDTLLKIAGEPFILPNENAIQQATVLSFRNKGLHSSANKRSGKDYSSFPPFSDSKLSSSNSIYICDAHKVGEYFGSGRTVHENCTFLDSGKFIKSLEDDDKHDWLGNQRSQIMLGRTVKSNTREFFKYYLDVGLKSCGHVVKLNDDTTLGFANTITPIADRKSVV